MPRWFIPTLLVLSIVYAIEVVLLGQFNAPLLATAPLHVVIGFFLLIKGADHLVTGAVAIARRTGLTPAVIGATVVAFGTSLPELVVSLGSNLKARIDPQTAAGAADIAVGNVVGSNIFNIGCILGLAALIRPLPVPRSSMRFDYPLMLVTMVAMVLCSLDWTGAGHSIGRLEGVLLTLGLVLFTGLSLRLGRVDADEVPPTAEIGRHPALVFLLLVGGVGMLAVGGKLSLEGALTISRACRLSERVIGLTVMAIGTSLPELATSLQAAHRGHTEIAVANVIGSNLFNILCVIGISSLVFDLPVQPATLYGDYWWMLGFALILLPIAVTGWRISRLEGGILLGALVTYVTCLLIE